MNTATASARETLRVEWTIGGDADPDQEIGECSLAEWLESNAECLDDTEDLLAFARGVTIKGGGGAAPEWTATLIASGGAA